MEEEESGGPAYEQIVSIEAWASMSASVEKQGRLGRQIAEAVAFGREHKGFPTATMSTPFGLMRDPSGRSLSSPSLSSKKKTRPHTASAVGSKQRLTYTANRLAAGPYGGGSNGGKEPPGRKVAGKARPVSAGISSSVRNVSYTSSEFGVIPVGPDQTPTFAEPGKTTGTLTAAKAKSLEAKRAAAEREQLRLDLVQQRKDIAFLRKQLKRRDEVVGTLQSEIKAIRDKAVPENQATPADLAQEKKKHNSRSRGNRAAQNSK